MNVIVGQPPIRPNKCAVLPFPHINIDPEMRFVDTGQDLWDDRIYVSEPAVKEMGRLLGFPTKEEHTLALAELEQLKVELDRLREEMREYDRRFEAIDVLESADYRARRKAGRPKSTQTSKAA